MPLNFEASLLAPKVLILVTPGTTRDRDLAAAVQVAGGNPQIVPVKMLNLNPENLRRYAMLALPGGFAYSGAFGAGQAWAADAVNRFHQVLNFFVENKKPVLGIGNGFRTLVKMGVLPDRKNKSTVGANSSGKFECRWVYLSANEANRSPWLDGLTNLECPVANGKGRFLLKEHAMISEQNIAFYYVNRSGNVAAGHYPDNPYGSALDIAGLTNDEGNVLGLMPNPENAIYPWQHPRWTRDDHDGLCLRLFENGLTAF